MAAAEVVETIITNTPCKNSIVCLASEAEQYGSGPFGVTTAETLDKFLTQQGWKRLPVCEVDDANNPFDEEASSKPSKRWSVVYVAGVLPQDWRRTELRGVACAIWVGPAGVGAQAHGEEGGSLAVCEGAVVQENVCPTIFGLVGINPFREAAEWAEGDLTARVGGSTDSSLREIKGAISGGGYGSVYLSDGVWL